jgi:hypothetical protein
MTAKVKEAPFQAQWQKASSQSQLVGGDAFNMKLAESHRFSSSGLSLAFEGLLLGVSLHL